MRKLRDFVAAEGLTCSLTNLALAWTLKNDNVTVVMLGARNAEQLDTTFRCLEAAKELDDARMAKIDKILGNKPERDMNLYNTSSDLPSGLVWCSRLVSLDILRWSCVSV